MCTVFGFHIFVKMSDRSRARKRRAYSVNFSTEKLDSTSKAKNDIPMSNSTENILR